jgi:hypothetical protein
LFSKASDYDVELPLVETLRGVVNSGENPVELTVNHDSTVTENSTNLITSGAVYTSVHAKPLPQLRMISFDKDEPINAATQSTTTWGLGARHKTIRTDRVVGDIFLSIINPATFNGTMTITANGYYRIRAAVNLQQDSYSDRLAFMIYLRINTTDYDEDEDYNFFARSYSRNTSDGAHANLVFEDYIYLTSGTTLEFRNKLDINSRNNWDNTLFNTVIDVLMNVTLERIYETDPVQPDE